MCCKEGRISKTAKRACSISKSKRSTTPAVPPSSESARYDDERGRERAQKIKANANGTFELPDSSPLSDGKISVEQGNPKTCDIIQDSKNTNGISQSNQLSATTTAFAEATRANLKTTQVFDKKLKSTHVGQSILPWNQGTSVRLSPDAKNLLNFEESDDDDGLPMPKDLLTRLVPKRRLEHGGIGTSAPDQFIQPSKAKREMIDSTVEADVLQKKHETDNFTGSRFSVEDILECVDIV